ncbi:MAG: class I SAM-dependent methyltransferase [Rhizobiales bacterium]|nr:class I SAM-dependent methyltransferase [Hyphomicrobiales bacterium]
MRQLAKRLLNRVQKSHLAPVPNLDCDQFEINNWIMSDFVAHRLVPIVGYHPYPLNEMMLMAGTVCRFKPSYIFEWGTNLGVSARIFHETASFFQINTQIHSVDLPDDIEHEEHPKNLRGKFVKGKNNVHLHLGDGLKTSLDIYNSLPEGETVLFFVDGDHSYESVKKELSEIVKQVKSPKVLLHDTFYQTEKSNYNIGPHQAVTEVMDEFGEDLGLKRERENIGLPGMTLVY